VIDVARVVRDIDGGRSLLRSTTAADLARPNGLAGRADKGSARLGHADRVARRAIPFRLVSSAPLLGRQVKALRSLTATARRVAVIGDRAARRIQPKLDHASSSPEARVRLLDAMVDEVALASRRLDGIEVPETKGALSPLRSAGNRLRSTLAGTRKKLRDASAMVAAVRKLVVGPSRIVILGGNNAEMRAGAMPLSVGILKIEGGRVTVGRFDPTGSRFLKHVFPDVPRVLDPLYYQFSIGQDWRGTAVTPNFPFKGPIYAQMAPRSGLGRVDGVIFVDVLALRAVMQATGPVTLGGIKYTTKNVVDEVLVQNYLRFPEHLGDKNRRDVQSQIAAAVFGALNSRKVHPGKLVSALTAAGKGRHVLAWARDPALEAVWRRVHIDGRLDPNGLMVNVQNVSANKLDYYIRPRVGLRTVSVKGGFRRVELKVIVENPPRDKTTELIEGTQYAKQHHFAPGEHEVFLVVYLPKSAFNAGSADPPFIAAGDDGPMKVVAMRYRVKAGGTRTVTITFSVPAKQFFRIIPSGRAFPVPYATPERTYTDDMTRLIRLSK
jgi:hypothetical protein